MANSPIAWISTRSEPGESVRNNIRPVLRTWWHMAFNGATTTADDGFGCRVTGGTGATGSERARGLWWNAFRSDRDGDGDSNTTTTKTRTGTTSTRTSQHKTESSTEARARGYRSHDGPPKCYGCDDDDDDAIGARRTTCISDVTTTRCVLYIIRFSPSLCIDNNIIIIISYNT